MSHDLRLGLGALGDTFFDCMQRHPPLFLSPCSPCPILPPPLLRPPQEDVFTLTMLDVGPPVALLLRTDARSNKPTWHVDCVVVEIPEGPRPGYPAFFVANCWLGPAPQVRRSQGWQVHVQALTSFSVRCIDHQRCS